MCNRNVHPRLQPLPAFRLTPTPAPAITSTRGPLARGTYLPAHEELRYLIETQDQDTPREWIDQRELPTGLTVRYGYYSATGTPRMLDPVNGWRKDGLPEKPDHVPLGDPGFDAEVLIDADRHAIWCDYTSPRVIRRLAFDDYLTKCGPVTRATISGTGEVTFSNLTATTPQERVGMAVRLRDLMCDADWRTTTIPNPEGLPLALLVPPDELDLLTAAEIHRTYDPDPFRYGFFDAELHDHFLGGGLTADEIRDALLTGDLAYGSYARQEDGTEDYQLDPVYPRFHIRNHNCKEHSEACEIAARNNSLTITRNLGRGTISSPTLGIDEDAPEYLPRLHR